ncbi:hypothetical protein NG726_16460, partial [Pseudomonas sp. MOB-449]|nr:hypothetical protein [Pseudomonas sp. MOB-449]
MALFHPPSALVWAPVGGQKSAVHPTGLLRCALRMNSLPQQGLHSGVGWMAFFHPPSALVWTLIGG